MIHCPLWGLFLAVFISHAVPLAHLPGYTFVALCAAADHGLADLAAAALAVALGAALGKVVVFFTSRKIGEAVMGREAEYAKRLFEKISKWGIDLAVVAFAASPLPDDVLYIPLGMAGYSLKRFFVAVLAGKAVLAVILVFFFGELGSLFLDTLGVAGVALTIGLAVLGSVLVARVKWSAVLQAYEAEGAKAALKAAFKSAFSRK